MSPDPVKVIMEARGAHYGTVVDWRPGRYGWRCDCGTGRTGPDDVTDWDTAADELGQHKAAFIMQALERAGLAVPVWNATLAYADLLSERARQEAKWGEQNHPDGTGPEVCWADNWAVSPAVSIVAQVRRQTDAAAKTGTLTWMDILLEELAEAFAEANPSMLRGELVQVAAVAIGWIEAIDRKVGAFSGGIKRSKG